MSAYVMAVDMGWQGTKAAVYDEKMNRLSLEFEEANLISPDPSTTYQDPKDILSSVERTIRRAIESAAVSADDIAIVGMCGQVGGIMGIDAEGQPVTMYDSWLDRRCSKYTDLMRAKAGKKIIEITGGPAGFNQGPKVLWWKNEEPETYAKIAKFVTPYAYVAMRMCGLKADKAYCDYTCLHESGFGDNKNKQWSAELLSAFDVPEDKLPQIVSPFDVIGEVTEEFAKESGLKAGAKVIAGAGDVAAAVFGSGFVKPGSVGEFAGSFSAVTGTCDSFSPDSEGAVAMMRSPVDGLWNPIAYTNGTGMAERWFKDTLTGMDPSEYAELDDEAKNVAPGSDGVFFVPRFACGACVDGAKGSFIGLDWYVTRAHLYRAMYEGTAYERRAVLDALKTAQPELDYSTVEVVGGETRSDLCNSIEAAILGATLNEAEIAEPALQGVAAVAAQAGGLAKDAVAAVPAPTDTKQVKPDATAQKEYDELRAAYAKLTELLKGFHTR